MCRETSRSGAVAALIYLFALLLAAAWAVVVATVLFPVKLALRLVRATNGRRQAAARD
jgi:hypothetical protein